jgi:dUTP pyrophosphatase
MIINCYSSDPSQVPVYGSRQSAGADLKASESVMIRAGERKLVKTGLKLVMPQDVVGLIHPRSGLAIKNGITVLNAPGTIDSDYRGEIAVILYNSSNEDYVVQQGDRIAQIVFQRYILAQLEYGGVDIPKEDETERGEGGFGSTGVGGE